MTDHLSLFQLNQQIKDSINRAFPDTVWVVAEISELRTVRSGHCYLELIEKDEGTDQIKAKVRATIWAFTYRMIKPYFETTTKQQLTSGLKVLVRASVEFQEVYGFTLNIKDIDPSFTLGDIARKRIEVIRRLEEEGVMDMNKELQLPLVPQRLAIISSPTAAGYEDFVNQLDNNQLGFKIYHKLFQAIMQGNDAEQSMISALDQVYAYEDFFDAVVIIRGGGSSADLMCFDGYWLAYHIAQFPLPVITGIGHERDESVADMVAHTKLKTPTAVAEFIIDQMSHFYGWLEDLQAQVVDESRLKINGWKHQLELAVSSLSPIVTNVIEKKRRQPREAAQRLDFSVKSYFDNQQSYFSHVRESLYYMVKKQVKSGLRQCQFHQSQLKLEVGGYLKNKKHGLSLAEKTLTLSDPVNVLERGYSIVYKDGNLLKSVEGLHVGDEIKTQLRNGNIISRVEKINY